MKLYIKNMVSNRCKMAVREELKKLDLHFTPVELGEVEIMEDISIEQLEQLKAALLLSGLELMDNKRAVLIERIKNAIIEMVHHSEETIKVNFSDFLSKKLNHDYTYMANLFSEVQGTTIAAILLNPLVNIFETRGVNKIIAISIAVLLAGIVIVSAFYMITSQLTMFSETYPQLKEKFVRISNDLILWSSNKFSIRQNKITTWLNENRSDVIDNIDFEKIISEGGRMILVGVLLPVYVFMLLYYKPLLVEFIRKLFSTEHQSAVAEILANTKKIIQSYLVGLVFEMIIIAVLNSTGLLLLGVDYAIILGITGAILNIIPYIGGIIAIALPMIIAFVTKDSITCSILVFFVYLFIQFIDNHFIIPKIVASRVKINALISVIVVLIGGAIWGIPGMFLSIPLTAIVKVIFDHIESLKPWGFLLGDTMPPILKLKINFREISGMIINKK